MQTFCSFVRTLLSFFSILIRILILKQRRCDRRELFRLRLNLLKKRNLDNAAFSGFDDDFVVWDIIDGL